MFSKLLKFNLFLCVAVFLCGNFAVPVWADETNQIAAAERATYRLGAGDTLNITIFGEDELSGAYILDAQGRISMPLIGDVDLLGRSLDEARDVIRQKYQNGYLNNPGITLDIEEFRPFYILGEVENPGEYLYRANLTVLNAVAMAGGFTYRARRNEAELHIPRDDQIEQIDIPMGRIIQPGDIIMIEERFF